MNDSLLNKSTAPEGRWYVITCLLALALFAVLAGLVIYLPTISAWDLYVSNWIQALRFPALDRLMLAVTLLGDKFVAQSGAAVILVYLLLTRHWKLFLQVLAISLSTLGLVFLFKTLIARDRPSVALETFSFPSGHATTAIVIAGVVALLIARGSDLTIRRGVYVIAAIFAIMVGVSRVYLQVHWPTDILAGWLLGTTLVVIFAWFLQQSTPIPTRWLTPVILGAATAMYVLHMFLTWTIQAGKYGVLLD